MARGGRLSYTPELLDDICDKLAHGITMAEICADPPMPSVQAVHHWCEVSFKTRDKIARARAIGEDYIAANTRKTARGQPGHTYGNEQRDKLVVDTDLRLLAFWNPKKYSEKKQLDVNINLDVANLFDKVEAMRLAQVAPAPLIIDQSDEDPLW